MGGAPDAVGRRWVAWAAYAACVWALMFAAMSFYWAAGGTAGLHTLGNLLRERGLARDPALIAITWVTGVLKVIGGLLALAFVRPWGRSIPHWVLLTAGWATGALLSLYGGASLVQHGLMAAGVIGTPEGLGSTALWWHLLLWDPWWLIGGIVFLVVARLSLRGPHGQQPDGA